MINLKTIKYFIKNPHDFPLTLRDKLFGIETQQEVFLKDLGIVSQTAIDYAPSGNKYLNHVLKQFKITPEDSIIDLGSGKGSALILFSKYPFRKVTGVEFSEHLHQMAEDNVSKLGIKNIQLLCMDAGEFQQFDEYNYLYLYHPFTAPIVEKVMENLERSLLEKPRQFTIIYKNPQAHQAIVDRGYFSKQAEYDSDFAEHKFFVYRN